MATTISIRGRGALANPTGRFQSARTEREEDVCQLEEAELPPGTVLLKDATATLLTRNDSPDLPFTWSLNAYRGCEHGCIYCFARPTHEYLGFSAGLDFETKIVVKEQAPELLCAELSKPKWQPEVIVMSGVTDCYQPVERKLQLTRRCLEVFAEFRNPVAIITKNFLVTRDVDLLGELASHHAVVVNISITSLDSELARVMEPRTATPAARLEAVRLLTAAGVPVNVLMAPVIPGLNDHEILPLLQAAAQAGARSAGYVVLRLPYGVKELFEQWLRTHFPDGAEKVLGRIRSLRGGELYDATWGKRMRGEGVWAEQIAQTFAIASRKAGLNRRAPELSTAAFRRPGGSQMELL